MEQSKIPSWIGSVAVHAAVVLALIFLSFEMPEPPPPPAGVPVTLVSNAPPASVQSEPTPAAQETAPPPAPEPLPTPPKPQPLPTPPPPKETPKPQPQPKPPATPTKPGKTKPTPPQKPSPPSTPFDPTAAARRDFGAAAASKSRKPLPPGPSQGPPKVDLTPAQSGLALRGFVDKVENNWNFDCSIAGNRNANIEIRIEINSNGYLVGEPKIMSGGGSELVGAAGPAAIRALKAGQPYSPSEVPPQFRNQPFRPTFHANHACANR
ncbi:MAG TPA: hypothetical protein VG407_14795 [Caulobacteraceae bacterium]|jgi:outer membrane biosynthesis protein TonB|nr:hypothetical protein [Caulobacteraceae bacterium]